ncbi:hypothetical protein CAJAP_03293 [Camponotus japonicus]
MYVNDMNEQESSHYINLDNGHFLFDLNTKTETDLLEPNYSCSSNHFTIEKSSRFLEMYQSHVHFPNYRVWSSYLDSNRF